jgi:hypothetical protein
MKISYSSLIEQEQAKIALLQAKITECERRIELLNSFVNADELDDLLTRKSQEQDELKAGGASAVQAQLPELVSEARGYELPKRRLTDDVKIILRYIGAEGKSLDELEAFCSAKGFKHNRGSLRSLASNYKTKHGFVTSPKLGFFKLAERGQEFLDRYYPDIPSETPSVSAEGVSDTSTQAALDGGTESDGLI